jgi:hypothetical protein
MKRNKNIFFDKIVLDDHIYFESELLKYMLPKYINLKEIDFNPQPKFIKVKNMKIDIETGIFNDKTFYKKNMPSNTLIEPIFIKNPNILELYYNKKNIKYEYTTVKASEDFINKEHFDILNILLKKQKDEINNFNLF